MGAVIFIIAVICILFPIAWWVFKPRIEYLEEEQKYVLFYWWGKNRESIIF